MSNDKSLMSKLFHNCGSKILWSKHKSAINRIPWNNKMKHINFSVCLSIFRICFKLLSDDKIYVHDLVVYFLYLSQYIFHLHFRTSNTCLNGYTDKYLRRKKLVSQKQSLGSLLKPIKCHRLYERNFWFLKNNKSQLKD